MKTFTERMPCYRLSLTATVLTVGVLVIVPWKLTAQEPQILAQSVSLPADPESQEAEEASLPMDEESVQQIASIVGLSADEAAALNRIDDVERLLEIDAKLVEPVNKEDTLPELSVLADLSPSEMQATEKLVSSRDFSKFENFGQHADTPESTQTEQTAIRKLHNLWQRQLANLNIVDQLAQDESLSDLQKTSLSKIRNVMNRQQVPSIFSIRQIYRPQPGARSSWTSLSPQQSQEDRPFHRAFVQAAINSPFPIKMRGSDEILFKVCVTEGNDDRLVASLETGDSGQSTVLELVRDQSVDIKVQNKHYSLTFASSWIARSTGKFFAPTAQIIAAYHPAKDATNNGVSADAVASSQDSGKRKAQTSAVAKAKTSKSSELKVLDRLVGLWRIEAIETPGLPSGIRNGATVAIKWILQERYLELGVFNADDKQVVQELMTYDTNAGDYKIWAFDKNFAEPGLVTLQWNESKKTFHGEAGKEIVVDWDMVFTNTDQIEVTGTIKDASGKVMQNKIKAKMIRKK